MKRDNQKISNWLESKYLEWRATQDRKHGSLSAFAIHLGIKEQLLNALVNGRRTGISKDTADKIANALDDDTIYDLVDLPRPDPLLRRINRKWHLLKESRKKYIANLIEQEAGQDGQTAETPERVVVKP